MKKHTALMVLLVCLICISCDESIISESQKTTIYNKHDSVPATCERDGQIEYYVNQNGQFFVFEDGLFREVKEEDTVIKKTGHTIVEFREDEIIHFQYNKCCQCGKVFDYSLPIVNITCEEIEKDYNECIISVSNCLHEYQLTGVPGQIKIRGNWTSNLEKKPYRIKFDKKQVLLGLNNDLAAKSWVLLADYSDKSMLRSAIALFIANQIYGGKYYSSDCCFVEVYLNNDYQGVYLLVEQQQINKGRVEIYENEEDSSNNIGYLLEYDRYYYKEDPATIFEIEYSEIPYFNGYTADDSHFIKQYVVKNDLNNEGQRQFINDRLQKIWNIAYDALYINHDDLLNNPFLTINNEGEVVSDLSIKDSYEALERIIDVESLVDTYLLNEIVQDMDIGYSSFFLSIDLSADGNKKLVFQAPWDFDWSFGNSVKNLHSLFIGNYLKGEPDYEKSNPWLLLVSNAQWFWELLQEKWQQLNCEELKNRILEKIDFFTNHYNQFAKKEFEKWERNSLLVWCYSENSLSARSQKDDSENLINYISRRFSWLDYYLTDLKRVKPSFE